MQPGLWLRWAVLHGLPRALLAVQARRGEPMARLLVGPLRGGDQAPLIEQIRARGRLTRTPAALVTADHEMCRTILRDDSFGASNPANMNLPKPVRWVFYRTDPQLPNPAEPPSMLVVDPPAHTRYRRAVVRAFTPRAIERLQTRIVEITEELLDRMATAAHPDLIADFAAPLPALIIAEILGIPQDQRSQMLDRGDRSAPLLDIGLSWKTFRCAMRSLREGDREFSDHIELLRADPGEDVYSQVIRDGQLDRRELGVTALLLAGAGFETTANLIGNAIVLLLRHPDQLAKLRDDPGLWPAAVEEVLRYDSPVQMTSRNALCDLELAGQQVAAGETVALLLGGANHDPGVFTEPDRFDITRANAKDHLSFSSGIHACLGANLARMEATIALRALFERFPDLQLDGPPTPRGLATLRGFQRMPATT
ncbi:cytochrome P450 [Mycolicibacter hiberniae]|uniref:Putative cytochrome P450 n=1 Tax=Mycolicibacter hiberniae TaxID=29314 RepID=A0A7I7X9Z3_9MYCO|nr:cytochrome P450 [Mycolicibacter hiberniae]MCV7087344.1 cytochrome P450 [Mycolicibacter hiberniae]ORV68007.1 cytochrome [Mycolicibacter hiberniae]BBZ25441.1 putative cytochrome P450 [Mycolicibacter hiberniae]